MKKYHLAFLTVFFIISCNEQTQTKKNETIYKELDALKQEFEGKEVTFVKKRLDESSPSITSKYAYTTFDKKDLAFEVFDHSKYILEESYLQIFSENYNENTVEENKMILIKNKSGQSGWISIDNIFEFWSVSSSLKNN